MTFSVNSHNEDPHKVLHYPNSHEELISEWKIRLKRKRERRSEKIPEITRWSHEFFILWNWAKKFAMIDLQKPCPDSHRRSRWARSLDQRVFSSGNCDCKSKRERERERELCYKWVFNCVGSYVLYRDYSVIEVEVLPSSWDSHLPDSVHLALLSSTNMR